MFVPKMRCLDCGATFHVECPFCGSTRIVRAKRKRRKRKRRV